MEHEVRCNDRIKNLAGDRAHVFKVGLILGGEISDDDNRGDIHFTRGEPFVGVGADYSIRGAHEKDRHIGRFELYACYSEFRTTAMRTATDPEVLTLIDRFYDPLIEAGETRGSTRALALAEAA